MRTTRRCSGEQQSHFSDLTSGPTIRDAGAGDHSCPGSRYLSLHNNYRNLTLQFLDAISISTVGSESQVTLRYLSTREGLIHEGLNQEGLNQEGLKQIFQI